MKIIIDTNTTPIVQLKDCTPGDILQYPSGEARKYIFCGMIGGVGYLLRLQTVFDMPKFTLDSGGPSCNMLLVGKAKIES